MTIDIEAETKNFFGSLGYKEVLPVDCGAGFWKELEEDEDGFADDSRIQDEVAQQITKAMLRERYETTLAVIRAMFNMRGVDKPQKLDIDMGVVQALYEDCKQQLKEWEEL